MCVWGLGFGVWGLGFGVWGLRFRGSGFGFRVSGFGFGFRVSGLEFWDPTPAIAPIDRSAVTEVVFADRYRAKMAHKRQSRPDAGLGFQVKVLDLVPSLFGSGGTCGARARLADLAPASMAAQKPIRRRACRWSHFVDSQAPSCRGAGFDLFCKAHNMRKACSCEPRASIVHDKELIMTYFVKRDE